MIDDLSAEICGTTSTRDFAVDSNIPLPSAHAGNNKYPWLELKLNDSFFVTNIRSKVLASRACVAGKKHGRKFATRKVIENGVAGVRCWRIA